MSDSAFEGFLDRVQNGAVCGWARAKADPAAVVRVQVRVDDHLVGTNAADLFRQDLLEAGIGTGAHAFQIAIPPRFHDDEPHRISAWIEDTSHQLHGSPIEVRLTTRPGVGIDPIRRARRAELDASVRKSAPGLAKPLVSVIIPCFNLGDYVDEAVDSVLEQTFGDVEIIVVDDGSTDPFTSDLLRRYDRPRTRTILTANQGVAAARNIAATQARGTYLCFLDADDRLLPNFLEKTIPLLESDASLAFVSTWLRTFGDEEWIWRQDRCDLPALLAECTVLTAAPLRRTAFEAVGGFDRELGTLFAEDWGLWIAIVEAGYRGTTVPEALFEYRRYAGSNSRRWEDPNFVRRVSEALIARHQSSYRRHLLEVLLLKERRIGDALQANYDLQREVQEVDMLCRNREQQVQQLGAHVQRLSPTVAAASDGASSAAPMKASQFDWGEFERTTPLSSSWGFDRGLPVDRVYIETFLHAHANDIRGDVLEVAEDRYTRRLGGERVLSAAVVDIDSGNRGATIVADLRRAEAIASDSFDCFIMTQTAYLIDDIHAVVAECARILRPGGVLLATLPCNIRLEPYSGLDQDFWRLGPDAAQRLFGDVFGSENVTVTAYGNLMTTTAFLYGLACEDLRDEEITPVDSRFPLTVGIRAIAPA